MDIPAQYSGEEFIVLLPETPVSDAANVAENLRRRIEETPAQEEKYQITITASFGVSDYLYKTNEKPLERMLTEFISKADQALYASKNAGRNRVTVYKPEGESLQ